MESGEMYRYSGRVAAFRDRALPEPSTPAGYAALIEAHALEVPLPRRLHAIGQHHKVVETPGWRLLTPRHAPENTLAGHLTFALKWEGLDLCVLKRLFLAVDPGELAELVRSRPTGSYARRIWFLYEWLTDSRLDLPDATRGAYTDALDPELQYGTAGERSRRHRVRNNLPGSPDFCPLVFRTEVLERFIERDLAARAREAIAPIPADVLVRAAAFLLLEDSKSSFAIEGEGSASGSGRIARWGQAIGQAGQNPLTLDELLRLQRILIGDARFVQIGLRTEGGFVGQHDRVTREPIPSHVSARPQDLIPLMDGLLSFTSDLSGALDPVIAAAGAAFGLVYIHPFEDGNGRLHRYLIHHVLAEREFNPAGLVFPVSAVILRRIEEYREVLETCSRRVLPLVQWVPTPDGNLRVQNDTGDLYRFFDATPHAEFLYRCVETTIEEDLPAEAAFIAAYDRFSARVQDVVEMPNRTIDLLFRFLRQNEGVLSKRARGQEFSQLTDEEIAAIEAIYADEATIAPRAWR